MTVNNLKDAAKKGAVVDIKRNETNHEAKQVKSSQIQLLLVFDQAHIARVLKSQLESFDCAIYTAHSAERALQMVHEYSFDAAVIDAELAGMGCQPLCTVINRQAPLQLFLTGANAFDIAAQSTDWPSNAQGLAWPFSVTELLDAIVSNRMNDVSTFADSKVGDQRQ